MGKSPINQHNFHVIPISFPYLPTNKRQFASKKIVCIKGHFQARGRQPAEWENMFVNHTSAKTFTYTK